MIESRAFLSGDTHSPHGLATADHGPTWFSERAEVDLLAFHAEIHVLGCLGKVRLVDLAGLALKTGRGWPVKSRLGRCFSKGCRPYISGSASSQRRRTSAEPVTVSCLDCAGTRTLFDGGCHLPNQCT